MQFIGSVGHYFAPGSLFQRHSFLAMLSSEKFELAQDELESLMERLQGEVDSLGSAQGEARKRAIQVGSRLLDEGSKALDEMEGEARIAPLQYRAEMLGSVRQQQSRLAKLRGDLQKAQRGMNRAPEGARERTGAAPSGPPDQYRQQVLAGTRVLERTGDSLARAQQVAVETDAVAGDIIEDLGTQRETLERTRNRLVETDVELGRSRRILKKMYLNVFTNKIVLILIIVIEICILGGLLYWKFGTKH